MLNSEVYVRDPTSSFCFNFHIVIEDNYHYYIIKYSKNQFEMINLRD